MIEEDKREPTMEVIDNFYDYIQKSLQRLIETWKAGEGDILIEVRDDKGQKRAKIKGGAVDRIG